MGPLTLIAEDLAFLMGNTRTAVPFLAACVLTAILAASAARDEGGSDGR